MATLGNMGLLVSKRCLGTMTFGDGKGPFKAIPFIIVFAAECEMALRQLSITRVLEDFAGCRVDTPGGQLNLIALRRIQRLGVALVRAAYSNLTDPLMGIE